MYHVSGYVTVSGEQYRGKHLGKLNSYHHQVSGDVYAVDEFTLLLTEFNYDGNGPDTFFWAGATNRPGPQGFIVPDEHAKYVDPSLCRPQVLCSRWLLLHSFAWEEFKKKRGVDKEEW